MNSFLKGALDDPHRARARTILDRHPEVRRLFGRNPWTAALAVGLIAVQLGLAASAQALGLGWGLPLAVLLGAYLSHAAYGIVHECAHDLVLSHKRSNRILAIALNGILGLPFVISYMSYHIDHHRHAGEYDRDADLPSYWEARLIGRRSIGKLAWLLFNPVFQALRGLRVPSRAGPGWVLANVIVVGAIDALVVYAFGWGALCYLLTAFLASHVLPPLGARYVQEHWAVAPPQETYSYYGPMNNVALNIGYHNEHHDFPFVPWNRLPRLRAIASDAYADLASHRSWWRLWFRFVFDKKLGMYDRIQR